MAREAVDVRRAIDVPCATRIERCKRMPELGPRILFFSGGTALRPTARVLKSYTHNSVHLITPFDSGGSSARLRESFAMPAVGDLRSRLLALADESVKGNPAVYELFSYRLSRERSPAELRAELDELIAGQHPLTRAIREPLQRLVRTHLTHFADAMPSDFDLRYASIGNLLLAGGYLANERDIDSVLFLFGKLIETRGVVRLTCDTDATLWATTEEGKEGESIVGQHRITADDRPGTLDRLWLGESLSSGQPATCSIAGYIRKHIRRADLICFPFGSFFTSVLANLLPQGVGHSIVSARCPKVYVPSTGHDPELRGIDTVGAIERLVDMVSRDIGSPAAVSDVVNFVVIDRARGNYQALSPVADIKKLGVKVIDRDLAESGGSKLDPQALSHVLLSLSS